jgi:IS5 family transposase
LLRDKGLPLKAGKVVGTTLTSAPSSTKNASGTPGPEMHRTKKGFASPKCGLLSSRPS